MTPTTRNVLKYVGYPICFIAGLQLFPFYQYINLIFWEHSLQSVKSGQTEHTATLSKKNNLADINFVVKVDNKKIYESADYVPYPAGFYQEHLVWDVTGKVVVLKLLGKRVFAYDAIEQQSIKKGELKNYNFLPDRQPDDNYSPIKDIDD